MGLGDEEEKTEEYKAANRGDKEYTSLTERISHHHRSARSREEAEKLQAKKTKYEDRIDVKRRWRKKRKQTIKQITKRKRQGCL